LIMRVMGRCVTVIFLFGLVFQKILRLTR
jgi:hypothetical protein